MTERALDADGKEIKPKRQRDPILNPKEIKLQKQVQPEEALRELWTAMGIPAERQDEIIRQIEALAKPGAIRFDTDGRKG